VDVDGNDQRPILRCQANPVRCSWLVTRNNQQQQLQEEGEKKVVRAWRWL
jgi:hypothetical protein